MLTLIMLVWSECFVDPEISSPVGLGPPRAVGGLPLPPPPASRREERRRAEPRGGRGGSGEEKWNRFSTMYQRELISGSRNYRETCIQTAALKLAFTALQHNSSAETPQDTPRYTQTHISTYIKIEIFTLRHLAILWKLLFLLSGSAIDVMTASGSLDITTTNSIKLFKPPPNPPTHTHTIHHRPLTAGVYTP